MNPEFLRYYEEELALFYERAGEFAADYPGIAGRLGGLSRETLDPGIKGLLEGAAFMAARVQLALRSEFSTFTTELLERLVPGALAPVPSAALLAAEPEAADPSSSEPRRFAAGTAVESVKVEAERGVACQFRLTSDLEIWPLALQAAEYLPAPQQLQELGLEVRAGTRAGLRLVLTRTGGRSAEAPAESGGGVSQQRAAPVKALSLDTLTVHLQGEPADVDALYEQLFAHLTGIVIRHLDAHGDPQFKVLTPGSLEQIGFAPEEALYGRDDHVAPGFTFLREFFLFPGKFAGFRLAGLRRAIAAIDAGTFEIIFTFDEAAPRLLPRVGRESFRLHAAPAVNLFEMSCERVRLRPDTHEYQVVPDRSRWLEYEPHRLTRVTAHYSGETVGAPVQPLYAPASAGMLAGDALAYSFRRLPRRPTDQELRHGRRKAYRGTETFLSIHEPAGTRPDRRARELSVSAICSNRHLAGDLAKTEGGRDFRLVGDTSVTLSAVAGPTPPREAPVAAGSRTTARPEGEALWRLIAFLAFNHQGLTEGSSGEPAAALREILGLFCDPSDLAGQKRLRGIVGVASRPVTRRLRRPTGFHAARGIEITVTFDEALFEGAGIMLIGAVLDRFFADYSHLNSFTETVVASRQRGLVKRWPPRSGTGPVL